MNHGFLPAMLDDNVQDLVISVSFVHHFDELFCDLHVDVYISLTQNSGSVFPSILRHWEGVDVYAKLGGMAILPFQRKYNWILAG